MRHEADAPLAALAGLLLSPAAHAAFPGSNGKIAFNWTFGCDGSMIATIKPDGSDRRLLTADGCEEDGPPRAAYPDWSADGSRLAYCSDGRLSTMAADGSGQAPLPLDPATPARPSISPDGKRIAYTRVAGGSQCVYVANGGRLVYVSEGGNLWVKSKRPGGTKRRLLKTAAIESSPVYSPDKKRIAFVRALRAGEEEVRYGVFTMRADGRGEPRRIFRTGAVSREEPLTISWQPR